MRIEDLTYFEKISDDDNIVGGLASVVINVSGSAIGKYTLTAAISQSWAGPVSGGGLLAGGYGLVYAIAYTPPSVPKFQNYIP